MVSEEIVVCGCASPAITSTVILTPQNVKPLRWVNLSVESGRTEMMNSSPATLDCEVLALFHQLETTSQNDQKEMFSNT